MVQVFKLVIFQNILKVCTKLQGQSVQQNAGKSKNDYYYLLMELNLLAVSSRSAHSAETVDGLIGWSGQNQELMPFMREESGVNFFGELMVKRQSGYPFH